MSWTKRLSELNADEVATFGGKACALGRLARADLPVPQGLAISTDAYRRFVDTSSVGEAIALELGRKRFEDMRWEEMWDASLRLRAVFASTPMPDGLRRELAGPIEATLGDAPVAVRSSAPSEDAADTSFAGLHESFVGVRGVETILEQVKLVWASLWSSRALLYRRELGLDPARSAMAVVVQRLVEADRAGVAFTMSPTSASEAVIEAVHGLGQALVDGTVEPSRWILDRATGALLSSEIADQGEALRSSEGVLAMAPLSGSRRGQPPLQQGEVGEIYTLARRCEDLDGSPQDVEWAKAGEVTALVQSRPVTTSAEPSSDDSRSWYLTLERSFDELSELRRQVEGEALPAMDRDARELAELDLTGLTDGELAHEISRRADLRDHWVEVYYRDFIPLAHGVRLFGQVYNDAVAPEDPFEFIDLLRQGDLLGLERNRELERLADSLEELSGEVPQRLEAELDRFLDRYGAGLGGDRGREVERRGVLELLRSMAGATRSGPRKTAAPSQELSRRFLDRFEGARRGFMAELLDLGRASYRLRDDDNIYLGRIEAQLRAARAEARRRLKVDDSEARSAAELVHALEDPATQPGQTGSRSPRVEGLELRARQLVGQPAGPGLAVGPARVILSDEEIFSVKPGEVIVCDAIDPTLTLAVPLASAIIERRGGMLIHGAIIAREYGIPCVTGIPDATSWIRTGDRLTVDGHLGIVVVSRRAGD